MATVFAIQNTPGLETTSNAKNAQDAWQHIGTARYNDGLRHPTQPSQTAFPPTEVTRSDLQPDSARQNGNYTQPSHSSQRRPDDAQESHNGFLDGQSSRPGSSGSDVPRQNGSTPSLVNGKSIRRIGSKERALSLDEDEDWNSRWIHRDKLAMIEIQEMQEAGIPIPFHKYLNGNPLRDPNTNAALKDRNVPDIQDRGWQREATQTPDDLVYSSQSQDEDESAILPDPRTPEEIAADPYEQGVPIPVAHSHGLRSSSSRIPLSTSSPVPVPIQHIERSAPLPRKRGASGNRNSSGDENMLAFNKNRRRSRSVGSTTVFDDSASIGNTPPQALANRHSGNYVSSPRNSSNPKTPGPATPRNASGHKREASGGQKPRTTSATLRGSPAQRPTTRSGLAPRPATAVNRPEGEAPWIATMFKPDPMLPPDQQLLPTYAKRLQQEQWEKEGRSGAAFDRNFNLISIQQDRERPTPSSQEHLPPPEGETEKGKEVPSAWPLTSPQESNSPKTPSSDHAGYRTIPRVHSTPSIAPAPSPRIQAPRAQSNIQKQMEVEPLKMERGKKEKGCGCCIVM